MIPSSARLVGVTSLVVGPLLMSLGDLMHPKEDNDAATQIAIIAEDATRWYWAHLLLFVGIILFIPGMLLITRLLAERRPLAGYWGRLLLIAGVASFAAIFVVEFLVGRFMTETDDAASATELLETIQSGWVLGVVGAASVAFFAGVAVIAVPFIQAGGLLRIAASLFVVGVALIAGEIISAKVILSQAGNILVLAGSSLFAWQIWSERGAGAEDVLAPRTGMA